MIVAVFRGVKWLHAELHRRIGPAYNVILGIGLVIEIIHRVRGANFHGRRGDPVLAWGCSIRAPAAEPTGRAWRTCGAAAA